MIHRSFAFLAVALLLLPTMNQPVQAAGRVELELVGDARGSAMAFQEWSRALGNAGIRNVRLRTAQEPGQPKIDVQGDGDSKTYMVKGIVLSRDEIQLPGARFRRSETGRLARWLDDVAAHGPAEQRERKAAFGLTTSQIDLVCKDLATPVGFRTQGVARRDVVRKIGERLKLPLQLDADATAALGDEKVEDSLNGLSCGAALAAVLRSAGYGLAPSEEGGQLGYTAVKSQKGQEVWPIGREPEEGRSQAETLPALYEFRNVNVKNVSAATTLDAVGKLLGAPIVLDRFALQRHNIDPAKVKVSHPQSKTTYSLALKRMLFQARLKFDLRCDEAGTPFLWVTTIKPVK
ncbi:MAG: hypothetical protein ABFC96_15425 [Thermoguttaceae bacterium]